MLKRLRTAHPILYCILAEVLFLGSLFLSSLVLTVALMAAGADFSGLDEYLLSLIQELVGAGAAWLLLRRTGRQGLLGRRGSGFWNGLLVGMYPLAFICYSIYSALIFERPDTPLLPAGRILSFLACMAMVGVAEEFLFRSVIQKERKSYCREIFQVRQIRRLAVSSIHAVLWHRRFAPVRNRN